MLLVGLIVALGVAMVGPTGASAFVGESVVLNGPKTDLTGPAKTILTKPTFLPANLGEAAVFGGAAESSGAASVFQASKVLPAMGAGLLAFGVGAAVGTEICGVIGIEGCWTFSSIDADPSLVEGEWRFDDASVSFLPDWTWYYKQGASAYWIGFVKGQGGMTSVCGISPPAGVTHYKLHEPSGCGGFEGLAEKAVPLRHAMENRTFTYTGADDPEVSNASHTAPSDWSERVADVLADPEGSGVNKAASDRVGEKIASEIEGSAVKNPYKTYVTVPDCDGLLWSACEDLLEEEGLEPVRQSEDWQGAVIEKDPGAVLDLQPATGAEVVSPSKVTVTTNPDEGGMPLVVPAIVPGEGYGDYIAKLKEQWKPQETVLSPEFTDPAYGPNDVTRTSPQPGTRADPSSEPSIDVYTNPPDAPPAAGTWTAPAIPAISLDPLAGVTIGCNDFPFGIFCWIGSGFTGYGSSGACPQFGVPVGTSVDAGNELPFDLCQFEPAMEVIRPVLVLVAAFSLAYLFAAAAMGFGGGSNED